MPDASRLRKLPVRTGRRIVVVDVEQVDWVEAAGNYVRLHVDGQRHLLRSTMSELEARLGSDGFLRIHRSAIVNVDRIAELRPNAQGEYLVVLHDGTELRLSRTYRSDLEALFGGYL